MDVHKFDTYGVSSKDQNESRQLEAMKNLGLDERDVRMDKRSGKDFGQAQYQFLKRMIRKSAVLYIYSLDRFGRNKELHTQIKNRYSETYNWLIELKSSYFLQ